MEPLCSGLGRLFSSLMIVVCSAWVMVSVALSQTIDPGMDFGGLGFAPAAGASDSGQKATAAIVAQGDSQDPSLASIPESVRPYLDIALMQYDLGNYREAEKELRRIMKMEETLAIPHYYLGMIYEKKLDLKEAVSHYQKALELDPGLEKAKTCLENLLETMLRQVSSELERDPGFAGSHKELGFIYYVKGDLNSARASLEKAISLDPELAEAYDYLGLVFYGMGDIRKAYQNIEKAFQLDSSDLRIFDDFKMISEKIIDSNEAVLPSESSDSRQPGQSGQPGSSSGNVSGSSENKLQTGDSSLSSEDDTSNGKVQNDELDQIFRQGVAALEAGNTDAAIDKLRGLTSRHRDFKSFDEALYALARAYETKGNSGSAMEIFATLVNKGYRKGESLFRMALMLEKEGKYAETHEILGRIKNEEPSFVQESGEKGTWVSRQFWITWLRAKLGSGTLVGISGGIIAFLLFIILVLPKFSRSSQLSKLKRVINASDWNQVLKITRKIQSGKFTESEKFDARLSMARARFEMGEFKACLQECKNILKMDGNNKFAQDLMGKSFMSEGSITDEAMGCYRKLFKYDYKNDDLVLIMVRYYVRKAGSPAGWRVVQKDLSDPATLSLIKRGRRISPEDQDILSLLAEVNLELNLDDIEALEAYEARLEADPSNDRIRKFLVRVYMERNQFDRGVLHARRVVQEEPENLAAHQALREAFIKRNMNAELLQEYQSLLRMHPDNLKLQDIHNRLTAEISGPVIKTPERTIQIGDLYGIFKKAGEHLRAGELDNAITLYKQCVRDSRLRKKASINLVICYMKKGSVHFAFQLFSKINIDADMTNPHIKGLCYDFARFFEERGEYDKALELYDRICKIDIGYKDVFDRFEEIFRFAGGNSREQQTDLRRSNNDLPDGGI